jgi:hypothetical protein
MPQEQALTEVSAELQDRRGSWISLNSSAASDHGAASRNSTGGLVVDGGCSRSSRARSVTASPDVMILCPSPGTLHQAGVAEPKRGRRTSAVHAVPTPPSAKQVLVSQVIKPPICCSRSGSKQPFDSVGNLHSDARGIMRPVGDNTALRAANVHPLEPENSWPDITMSPQNIEQQQSPLTELQQLMQAEPTMLQWSNSLDGHQPISAGRRGGLGIADCSRRVKKTVLQNAGRSGSRRM